jgi:hypothetical protein
VKRYKVILGVGLAALAFTAVTGASPANKTPAWANSYVVGTTSYADPVGLAWVRADLKDVSNKLENEKPSSHDEYQAWLKQQATDYTVLAASKAGHDPRSSRCKGVLRTMGDWVKFRCRVTLNGVLTRNYDYSSLGPDKGLAMFGARDQPWQTRTLLLDTTSRRWTVNCPWRMHAPPTPCRPPKKR